MREEDRKRERKREAPRGAMRKEGGGRTHMYDMGKYGMRLWHHILPGWNGNQRGSSQSSGGMGFTPAQSYTPRTASQNLPQ